MSIISGIACLLLAVCLHTTYANEAACPEEFSGYLPYPDDCSRFLQCEDGATYVLNCGPGTGFNAEAQVCDWPQNIPNCKVPEVPTYEDEHWYDAESGHSQVEDVHVNEDSHHEDVNEHQEPAPEQPINNNENSADNYENEYPQFVDEQAVPDHVNSYEDLNRITESNSEDNTNNLPENDVVYQPPKDETKYENSEVEAETTVDPYDVSEYRF